MMYVWCVRVSEFMCVCVYVCVWYAVFMLCVPVDIREYVGVGVHASVYVSAWLSFSKWHRPASWPQETQHAKTSNDKLTSNQSEWAEVRWGEGGREWVSACTSDPVAMHIVPRLPRKREKRRPKGRDTGGTPGVHPTPEGRQAYIRTFRRSSFCFRVFTLPRSPRGLFPPPLDDSAIYFANTR